MAEIFSGVNIMNKFQKVALQMAKDDKRKDKYSDETLKY